MAQYSPIWDNKEENINQINDLVNEIDKDTSLLIFPEMTLTGFTMDSKKHCEEIDGLGILYFINLARKIKTDIMAGIIEKDGKEYFNSLFHFDADGLIKAIYRKIHPFSLAKEDENYSRGKEIVTSSFNFHKIGLSICYDLRFPELYRMYAKEKAEIMVNMANWPVKRIEHWKQLLRARAIENQCFIIGVNRVGSDPYQDYNGCSAIYNPMGEDVILVENEATLIYADIDLDEVKTVRTKLGFLNDIKLI